ncbi:MAG: hypothetical protein K5837_03025 [Candidatus Saccharibacteria bacterium]|nr:hypothetical protein [Candidatus Saccharibacteria bacterium]
MTARCKSVIIESELLTKVGTFKEVMRMYWLRTYLAIAIVFFLFTTMIGITAMVVVSSIIYCIIGAILGIFGLKRLTKYVFALVMVAYFLGFL